MLVVYGLKTCDTCRKALKWLQAEGIAATFRDLRAEPPPRGELADWLDALGAEVVINRRGTTWRGLSEEARAGDPLALIAAHPALIKRPVFAVADGPVLIGFTPDTRAALIARHRGTTESSSPG